MAERKVLGLLEAGARVKVVSPEATTRLAALAKDGRIEWVRRPVEPGDLDGAWLAFAATSDPEAQMIVSNTAHERMTFCNVADLPDSGSIILPATLRCNELVIAVSTGGLSPSLACRIRDDIERSLGPVHSTYVTLLGALRSHILETEKDPGRRSGLCRKLADTQVLAWMGQGNWACIEAWGEAHFGAGAKEIIQKFAYTQGPDRAAKTLEYEAD